MNKEIFLEDSIEVWNRELLGIVLKRAAELGIALPDGPVQHYTEQLNNYVKNNPEAITVLDNTVKQMFQGTEREQLIKQRIGQNVYREALLTYWKSSCSLTSIDIPEILRASHIKPWADCANDSERLNVYNGLLLAANYDALFDKGLITFDNNGKVIYSRRLKEYHIRYLGGNQYKTLRWIDEQHLPFLDWHRKNIFTR